MRAAPIDIPHMPLLRRRTGRRGTRLDAARRRRVLRLLAGLVAFLALWLALAETGCHHAAPPAAPSMVVERRACLADPPPLKPALVVAGPAQGCPSAFLACMSRGEYLKLVRWLRELRHWSDAAYLSCGPLPENQPPADAGPGGP